MGPAPEQNTSSVRGLLPDVRHQPERSCDAFIVSGIVELVLGLQVLQKVATLPRSQLRVVCPYFN
jgi:hypothetical protein